MINKINEILLTYSNPIIVLKGISEIKLPTENKFFDFNIGYIEDFDIEASAEIIEDQALDNRKFKDSYKWMTIEEFQLLKQYLNIIKNPIVILENNLFDKQYPYLNNLKNIEEVYSKLYSNDERDLDSNNSNLLDKISNFYGQIEFSKSSENYYVTHAAINHEVNICKLYDDKPIEIDKLNPPIEVCDFQIELSDDESQFLDIIMGVNQRNAPTTVEFILSGPVDRLPYNYLERINILKQLNNVKFYFTSIETSKKQIPNEKKYLKLLEENYGYKEFRNIKFYKNIESSSKECIEISQVQIVNDIVEQAENALNNQPFRDIYITAATGAGKSVMFQIPALYLAETNNERPLTLVISPLIGLMKDQVDTMVRKGINNSATINSNTAPFEREAILDKIKKEEIDVLYLSPETLQARGDIKFLIGERKIGVVIIDEAHIVTTWGKTFRADYWFLGIYLSKLRKEFKFPIVTFTATSIYGGKEDMYLDTRNSLNMINPISYFGYIKRDDIYMAIKSSKKEYDKAGHDYQKVKKELALRHLKNVYKKKQKTLVYFPTVKLLNNFYKHIHANAPDIAKVTGQYYGPLSKEQKDQVLKEYKDGNLLIVLATKAFGMGIDIGDISTVYHYAPTGNVVDYIQEIGRVARDKDKTPYGFAFVDFLQHDLVEVKRLHGLSTIRKPQLIDVMKKIYQIYMDKGCNRNIIVSPDDFKHIFVHDEKSEDTIDNKVKTALLMIEKDFSSPKKLGYPPIVARPRSLYGNDLILVDNQRLEMINNSRLSYYFKKIRDINSDKYIAVYQVNLAGIWEKHYKKLSYPEFKYTLYNDDLMKKHKDYKLLSSFVYTSGIEIIISNHYSTNDIFSRYKMILNVFADFINQHRLSGSQFTIEQLGDYFMAKLKIQDRYEARSFAQTIINACFQYVNEKNTAFIVERTNSNTDNQRFKILDDASMFNKFILHELELLLNPKYNYCVEKDVKSGTKITVFKHRGKVGKDNTPSAILGIGEARNLLGYQISGGNNPQIYLRINSIYEINEAIKRPEFYRNDILFNIQNKHYTNVEMLKYLFTKEFNDVKGNEKIIKYTEWFWDTIEDYFMGNLPEEVRVKRLKDSP